MNAPISHPLVVDDAATFRERVLPVLRAKLGDDIFGAWLARLELAGVTGGTAHLTQPTKFLVAWVRDKYSKLLLDALSVEIAGVVRFEISVRTSDRVTRPIVSVPAAVVVRTFAPPTPVQAPQASPAAPAPRQDPVEQLVGSPLDRNLTFDRFLVAPSNRAAHAAATAIVDAERGDAPRYSPLFLHGSTGLGKSHLLQAVAHGLQEKGCSVLCYSLESFMYGFAATERRGPALERALRGVDAFLVDDLQFLHGERAKTVFEQTIDVLLRRGIQIVLAADRPPADLDKLSDRTRSRLSGGLTVEIKTPDLDLRTRMLQGLVDGAVWPSGDLVPSSEIIAFVASQIEASGRDLAGAVNRMLSHVSLTREALTIETATIVIGDLVRTRAPKRIRIEDIQKLVAAHYNVSRNDIMSTRRTANVVRPRQIAMYLAKILTLRSLPEIGRQFGGRDHTTALWAVRKIEDLRKVDRALDGDISHLRSMLEDA